MSVVHAPELDRPGVVWLNTEAPLTLAQLRGRLVVLHFWTFGCVNCLHALATLRSVEQRFGDTVIVIGVHSPKFAAERDVVNLRAALRRLEVHHPVAHDPGHVLWDQYAIRAWPTLVLVDPQGRVLATSRGEPDTTHLIETIERIVGDRRAARRAPELPVEVPAQAAAYRYPTRIRALPAGALDPGWVLADTGHHQIVVLDERGAEQVRFGDGAPGFADGPAHDARFDGPHGLIATDFSIFVADTGNHAIRRIELATGRVETIAGTGRRGRALGPDARSAEATALASPWDLELLDDRLLVANAGTHQILALELGTGRIARLAGAGAEGLVDGPAGAAQLAQPSGLALDAGDRTLYFVDAESSAVRLLTLDGAPRVLTLAGVGLWEFGHVNGDLRMARFQHPTGIARLGADRLVVADTYNGVLRALDTAHRRVIDLGSGFPCIDRICLPLAQPTGVAVAPDGRLLVVDSGNHRVLVYDLALRRTHTWSA